MGTDDQLNDLTARVYDELVKLARHIRMFPRRPGIQTTSLAHEVYLRLAGRDIAFKDKQHFMRVAATAMRRLLVDRWRRQRAAKRGGHAQQVPLSETLRTHDPFDADLLALDEALDALAKSDPRKCSLVELRYFGGCTMEETAGSLAMSVSTANREWEAARAWLYKRLNGDT